MKFKIAFSLIALLVSTAIFADMGPYVEGNIGYSSTGNSTISNTQTLINQNDNHFGWNINAGVMFFGLGVEAGYIRFADVNYQGNTQSAPADLSETHLALRTTQSIGPLFFMGKLGYGQLQRGSFNVSTIQVDNSNIGGVFWGLGAGIKFIPTLRAQVEYQQVQGNNDAPTASILTVGLGWTFL